MCRRLNLFGTGISYFETQKSFVDTAEKFPTEGLLSLSCAEKLQLNFLLQDERRARKAPFIKWIFQETSLIF